MMKNNNKAVCYYRVSSEKQRENESIDLQKYTHQGFIQDKGYDVVAEFEDDGISGKSIDSRPSFQKTQARIGKGDIDALVVYFADRISRFKNFRDRNRVIELLADMLV